MELAVGPHRSEDPDGHVDPEDQPPVDGRQHTARDQPDELSGQGGDLVDAEREAASIEGEGVGQDGGRVGGEHGTADCLQHAPADQPHRSMATDERIERKQDRSGGEHRKAGVVDPDSAEHVAEAAESDHENCLDQPVPHDHPQQVEDVARRQRVKVDAAKDRRQSDDDDRTVERRHEHGGGRVRQRHPPVAFVRARLRRPGQVRQSPTGWSMLTGGSPCTSSFVSERRMPSLTVVTALIGMATCLRPHRCPSCSRTCVT